MEAEYRALQQDPSVLALCIAPTYACNPACPYCYGEGRSSSGKMMGRAMQEKIAGFAKLAFEAQPYDRIEVQRYGGEPMLAPDAIEAISTGLAIPGHVSAYGLLLPGLRNRGRTYPRRAMRLEENGEDGRYG